MVLLGNLSGIIMTVMTANQLRKLVDITFDFFFQNINPVTDSPCMGHLSEFYKGKM